MPARLPPVVEAFLDQFSATMAGEGLPRPAGRMLGLFFVEGTELTAEALAARLGISRSNVSTTVRLLESYGLVERTRRAGERQDRFRLPAEPFRPMLHAGAARAARMRDQVAGCRAGLPAGLRAAGGRLAELEAFFDHAARWLGRMRDEWPDATPGAAPDTPPPTVSSAVSNSAPNAAPNAAPRGGRGGTAGAARAARRR